MAEDLFGKQQRYSGGVDRLGGGGGLTPPNPKSELPPPATRGPYQKAPDSLMGYRRNGPQKPFEETNYKHTQWVEVTHPDGSKHVDAMNGLNQKHAMERAFRNWEGAKIRPVSKEEALLMDPELANLYPGEFGKLSPEALRALGAEFP